MKRFPQLETDWILSDNAPVDEADAKTETPAPAETGTEVQEVTATTQQAAPLRPQVTGVLEPISGGQVFILVLFGIVSAIGVIGMSRFGSKSDYGD